MELVDLITGLALNLAITLPLVLLVFRPRHGAALVLPLVVLNLGTYGVTALLAGADNGLAIGMGLFGVLSLVRLTVRPVEPAELAYAFVAVALGLVHALGVQALPFVLALDALVAIALVLLDRGRRPEGAVERRVVLDVVHDSAERLHLDLAQRLQAEVLDVSVVEVDFVREVTVCDVRTGRPASAAVAWAGR